MENKHLKVVLLETMTEKGNNKPSSKNTDVRMMNACIIDQYIHIAILKNNNKNHV